MKSSFPVLLVTRIIEEKLSESSNKMIIYQNNDNICSKYIDTYFKI